MNGAVRKLITVLIVIGALCLIFFSGLVLTTTRRGAKKTIEFWGWGKYDRIHNLAEAARAFEREHPDIRVKFVPIVASNLAGKIDVAIASGRAGDVIEQHYLGFPRLAYREAFLDLTPYIEEDNFDLSDFFPIGLEAYKFRGALYGLPLWGSTFCLIYNKDLFDEERYPYPDDTWTFEDLKKATDFFTRDRDGDGMIDQFGLNPYEFSFYLWSNGGDYVNEEGTKCLMDTPAAIESVEYFLSLLPPKVTLPELGRQFDVGNVAMTMQGPWAVLDWEKDKPFAIGVARFPKGKLGRQTRYSGVGVCIWEGTKYPRESWEFVKFLASREGISRAIYGEDIPARRSLAYSDLFIKPGTPYDEEVFIRALEEQARIPARLPELAEVAKAIVGGMDDIRYKGKDLETTLRKTTKYVDEKVLARRSEVWK